MSYHIKSISRLSETYASETYKKIYIEEYKVQHSNSTQLIFLGKTITKYCDLNGVWDG